MALKGLFSFKNDKVLQINIADNVFIRLERVGFAIARLFFVDGGYAETNIPEGLRVIDETFGGAVVQPYLGTQAFVLAWSDNYRVMLNDVEVLGLANQRQWSVSGPRAAHVEILE